MTLNVLLGMALLFAWMGGVVWLAVRVAASPRMYKVGRFERIEEDTDDV